MRLMTLLGIRKQRFISRVPRTLISRVDLQPVSDTNMYTDEQYLERIQTQRNYWMKKTIKQLDKVFMASLDQDSTLHESLTEDLNTSLICLWRFDGKLEDLRRSNARAV